VYRFTSRPTNLLWISGQYRLYDFDNRTPRFEVAQYVRLDGNVATSATGGSHAFSYTRHVVDVDASVTPFRFTAFGVGYSQHHDDRTFRFFEQTTDRTVRASIDSTGLSWGSIRVRYDRSVRAGEGLDEQVLSDIGEQVSLRQFDIADRTRNRIGATVYVIPAEALGLSLSAAVGTERRPEAAFGLHDNDLRTFTAGLDYTPGETIGASLAYGIERYTTRQKSRQARSVAEFDDPSRDWFADMNEHVHTVALGLDLPRLTTRTSARLGYDFVASRVRYVHRLPANTTLSPVEPLPRVHNLFHVMNADVLYSLTNALGLGIGYRWDRYDVEDFALSPGTLNTPLIPGFFNLLYQWRDYDAHTGFLRLVYRW
jgi:hypothetical protein